MAEVAMMRVALALKSVSEGKVGPTQVEIVAHPTSPLSLTHQRGTYGLYKNPKHACAAVRAVVDTPAQTPPSRRSFAPVTTSNTQLIDFKAG